MDCKSFVVIAFFAVVAVEAAHPVFLQRNGAVICTLNKLGAIPSGALNYPVYQKVCRAVTPVLGVPLADEENSRRSNTEKYDDEVEKVYQAIMSMWTRSERKFLKSRVS